MDFITNSKIKLLRVVTQAEVVPWHLKNFIDRSYNDYDLYIAGNGVSKYKAEYPNVTFIDFDIQRKISFFLDVKAVVELVIICIKVRPQIIHSIMPKSGLLASVAGLIAFVPTRIHTFTGQVWMREKGISRFFYKMFDKMVFNLNTVCLTDSPSQSVFLANNGFLANNKPISYLGKGSLSGVNLDKFDSKIIKNRNELRNKLGIRENDFVFVYLARKSIIKGIVELFESFNKLAHLPNVKLLFIGPDESEGRLEMLYQQYSSIRQNIICLDIVKDHELYLAVSDVLCLPSSSEGFGSVVIEAAALGVPTIGFDIVGLSDSVENNVSGILVPFKDINKFSEAMSYLYHDKEALKKMKLNAQNRVLKYFSADVIFDYQNEFYKSYVKSN